MNGCIVGENVVIGWACRFFWGGKSWTEALLLSSRKLTLFLGLERSCSADSLQLFLAAPIFFDAVRPDPCVEAALSSSALIEGACTCAKRYIRVPLWRI